jgi:hypothetical protein
VVHVDLATTEITAAMRGRCAIIDGEIVAL